MAKISKYSLDESVSGGDKVIGTDGTTGLTKNFSVNELGAYLQDVYNITGVITINGKDGVVTINTDDIPQGTNNLYDKEVTLTGVGATQVTGEYPNFTISSTDTNTQYVAGDGIRILGGQISNTAPDLEVSLTGYGGVIVTGTYPNFNIEVVDNDTTYTAGSGISISSDNVITNTNQDRPINIVGQGATTVTGTYPNFTISSTDNNTLYSAGENIEIIGTTINAIIPPGSGETYTAGDGISISEDNVISNTAGEVGGVDGVESTYYPENPPIGQMEEYRVVINTTISSAPDANLYVNGTARITDALMPKSINIGGVVNSSIPQADDILVFQGDTGASMYVDLDGFRLGVAPTLPPDNKLGNTLMVTTNQDLHVAGDIIGFSTSLSDKRLKDNIEAIPNALDKVSKLRGVSYEWNKGIRKGQKDLGLIAQEVEEILPELVKEKEMHLIDGETYKTVDYEKIVGVLVEAIKELKAQVEELKSN